MRQSGGDFASLPVVRQIDVADGRRTINVVMMREAVQGAPSVGSSRLGT